MMKGTGNNMAQKNNAGRGKGKEDKTSMPLPLPVVYCAPLTLCAFVPEVCFGKAFHAHSH